MAPKPGKTVRVLESCNRAPWLRGASGVVVEPRDDLNDGEVSVRMLDGDYEGVIYGLLADEYEVVK